MGSRVVERPWCIVAANMIELLRSKGQVPLCARATGFIHPVVEVEAVQEGR